jgi:hypothetical protein
VATAKKDSKAAAVKSPAKKAAATKAPAKKAPAKKAAATKAAEKAPTKKAPAKKAAATKAAAKAPAKKAAAAKAPSGKSATDPKAPAKARKAAAGAPAEASDDASSKLEIRIPVERQKAAQAAGNFELEDLPGELATPAAALRIGKNGATDKPLKLVRTIDGIAKLKPGQVIANYGKSEAKWATDFNRRRANKAAFLQLLSYSRQVIGIDSHGRIRICLMGHAGQGPSTPLWVLRDEVVLTVQPNDIILRFEGLEIEE